MASEMMGRDKPEPVRQIKMKVEIAGYEDDKRVTPRVAYDCQHDILLSALRDDNAEGCYQTVMGKMLQDLQEERDPIAKKLAGLEGGTNDS